MVPDPAQVLFVVKQATLLATFQLAIIANLTRLGIVLQVELVQRFLRGCKFNKSAKSGHGIGRG